MGHSIRAGNRRVDHVALALRLGIEQIPARNRNTANRNTFGLQTLRGFQDQTDF